MKIVYMAKENRRENMFLPISKEDLKERKIEQLDFIMITGEAYVDHPSFGHAIISRYLESLGFQVGIIAQPQTDADYQKLGKPNIAFLVSSGVIDSMVNNYTVAKNKRKKDVYSPAGKPGLRPDMATVVYTKKLKALFPDVFCIIGSIEVSLRRFAHYDYWKDTILKPILSLSGADLAIYGMGERPFYDIAQLLKRGVPIEKIKNVRGTMYQTKDQELIQKLLQKTDVTLLPSFEEVSQDKKAYAKMHMDVLKEQDDIYGKCLIQQVGDSYVVQNKPQKPLEVKEMDQVYALPYERTYHPSYEIYGGVPAIEEVEFSLTSNRGCFGACNYCALTYHQGRKVQVRSHESIVQEAQLLTKNSKFKGYIHDVGGPTANFRRTACEKQKQYGVCKEKQCMTPTLCKNVVVDHSDYIALLRKLRKVENVKKVFIRSGIRFDYMMADNDPTFLKELCEHHISGQLKVAPEHCSNRVLEKMGKPKFEVYLEFAKSYQKMNEKLNKNQYLVSYFISSHPGCQLQDAIQLAQYLHSIHYMPEQVQDFYPTPGTVSTCMYYTNLDPRTMQEVYVPKKSEEKAMQRALLQYRKPQNYALVKKALIEANRIDLIGFEPTCLIRPRKEDIAWIKKWKIEQEEKKKQTIKKKRTIRHITKKKKI